jgi:hypothetical protein
MVEDNRHPDAATSPPQSVDGGHSPDLLEHPTVRYETSDASFRWVLGLVVAAVVFLAVVLFVIQRFFSSYESYQAKIKASNYPLSSGPSPSLPSEPRLEQINRMEDIQSGNVHLREQSKESRLNRYGTVGDGYVHIPIDRAMYLLADKLPVRPEQPSEEQATRANGLVNAGASNSGRMFRGKTP